MPYSTLSLLDCSTLSLYDLSVPTPSLHDARPSPRARILVTQPRVLKHTLFTSLVRRRLCAAEACREPSIFAGRGKMRMGGATAA
jgi:hypothetical protein